MRWPQKFLSWLTLLITILVLRVYFSLLNRLEIQGRQNSYPLPTIFYANHQSRIDGFLLFGCLASPVDCFQKISIRIWALAYEKYFRGLARIFIKPWNLILVKPGQKPLEARRTFGAACWILRQGEQLLIFPEGAVNRGEDPKTLAPFQSGLERLAEKFPGSTLVPVALINSSLLLPPGTCLPRIGKKVRVIFGKPMHASNFTVFNHREIGEKLRQELKNLLETAH